MIAVDRVQACGPASLIEGFTRRDLARLFAERGYRLGAEIGTAEGKYAEILCRENPGLRLLCVDPWAPYDGNLQARTAGRRTPAMLDGWLDEAKQRLAPYDVCFMRAMSADAAPLIETNSLDFVYIDANHAYPYVLEDLELWSTRVKAGGIVSGHDYYDFRGGGVVAAVNDFTKTNGIHDWWLTDARHMRRQKDPQGVYYREHSYFWINP